MKYQHILNKEVLFETDNATEYFTYLLDIKGDVSQTKHAVLRSLLEKSNGHICEMATA
jgi:hypothetical protein